MELMTLINDIKVLSCSSFPAVKTFPAQFLFSDFFFVFVLQMRN